MAEEAESGRFEYPSGREQHHSVIKSGSGKKQSDSRKRKERLEFKTLSPIRLDRA
jgi:hypothetical protein